MVEKEIDMGAQGEASGPDFSAGIAPGDIPEQGTLAGRVGDQAVLLSRIGGELTAVSGTCTHYGAALGSGLVEGETVRCPLHHACFSLRTGAALRGPALDALACWSVEVEDGRVFVRKPLETSPDRPAAPSAGVERVVIVGGGAAGLACANELRRLGYAGTITMLSADSDPPCDRPNLSKDYLAGTAPEEWLPLRGEDWYAENNVDLRLGMDVQRVDPAGRRVQCADGQEFPFDRLLIATGSEPNRLRAPGFDGANVLTLRSVKDARAIAARARPGARFVIVGSSFIGLEAAAALRKREAEVEIIAPERIPFERLFGAEIGAWLQRVHERNGVRFHLGASAASFDGKTVRLANGSSIEADCVLVGIGVRPRTALAETAGLRGDGGVPVDCYLETVQPGIFAAGDIAAFPDPLTRESVRIEHWVTAQHQGQAVAANMLGLSKPFEAVPFFWTEQFDVSLRYVGHAARWDKVEIDGDVESGDFLARYFEDGKHRASAGVGRDHALLEEEQRFEHMIAELRESREPAAQPGIKSGSVSVEAAGGS
jgi:NADPH-dependent 2,4-dienoyl-CoA reductase/sulfur reductase-like enzyme/nitrite reductase/ring-hydroxylating ferredoxin subunit